MGLFGTLKSIWGSDPASLQKRAEDHPHIVKSEIDSLEQALVRGDEEEQAAAANAIATGVLANTTVGETLDVFQVILQNVNNDTAAVRQPLVRSLGKVAPIVGGDAKRQLLASSHILAQLLERDDTHTVQWTLPAVSRAVREYPDPFIDYVDTIASGLSSSETAVVTSATETLATIAEQHYKPVKPHVPALLEQADSARPYQGAEAMRAVALVAANAPRVVEGTDYISSLKTMHGQNEAVYEQYAVRSIGYLLSSEPGHFQDGDLLPLVKQSLQHQNNHIQKDATIAYLRIIHNTDIDILDDPDTAHDLNYSIEQHNLRDQLVSMDHIADKVKAATRGT